MRRSVAVLAILASVIAGGTALTVPLVRAALLLRTPARTDRDRLVLSARSLLGTPYRWGAKGPDAYDCSGFTKAAYEAVGVRLPDGSFNQADGERPLRSLDELTVGDLLFYRWNGAVGVSHVTMYLGGGWVIGTGSPATPDRVGIYPLWTDFQVPDTTVTFRHVAMPDGS
ncbi:MAG: C40 family peptidase [Coriobacteriia bacterium]|nr:C40 family peptidase [Coriobacteriia bacterium]